MSICAGIATGMGTHESRGRMEELKPCPFCGAKVKLRKEAMWWDNRGYKDCYRYAISCPECGCALAMRNNDTISRTDSEAKRNAIKAWNRRVKE